MELGLLVLLLLLINILNFLFKKWLLANKEIKISATDGEMYYKWGTGIISLIGLSMVIFINVMKYPNVSYALSWILLIFLLVMYSFQSFMEWKYIKETKQYVVTLILMGFSVLCIFGVFFINDQMKYTTFQDVVGDQLNDQTTVDRISINIYDQSGVILKRTIENKKTIKRILDDFSHMKLKTDKNHHDPNHYIISIVTTNEVPKNHSVISLIQLNIDKHDIVISINDHNFKHFKVVSDLDPLKTIKSLVKAGHGGGSHVPFGS